MSVDECVEWLDKICADMREQRVDLPQVLLDDEGVGLAMSMLDELELLSINLRMALTEERAK